MTDDLAGTHTSVTTKEKPSPISRYIYECVCPPILREGGHMIPPYSSWADLFPFFFCPLLFGM